jgi:phospholipase C
MIISIVNRSKTVKDEQLLNAIRAINRQVREDFEPYWSFGATLRLEGVIGKRTDKAELPEMRGDAILYLSDKVDVADALGYHEANFRGIPYGFVFTELCKKLKENWTVTLSHEALELIGDAQGNLLVQGPHPANPAKEVFHWFEMCDAVQAQSYTIDGVEVSNFLLPLYFTPGEQEGSRNDFLGRLDRSGNGLKSFGVAAGGYIGYYDPQTRSHETYFAPDDKEAQRRSRIKNENKTGRGYLRKRGDATVSKEDEHERVLKSGEAGNATCPDPIRHIVMLMMENRSFDHMLGDATKIYPDLEGIPRHGPKYRNTATASGKSYEQTPTATETVKVDLPHEFVDVKKQLNNGAHPMGGFVDAYLAVPGVSESNPGEVDQVMAYFPFGDTPAQDSLPALHALARNFLVCDHWFSSMPGPTWPNRFFMHSGTCLGHVLMPSREHPEYMRLYDQDTIYDRLDNANRKWRIYHNGTPQSIVMSHMWLEYGTSLLTDKYATMDEFLKDAAGPADNFPEYAFIEPRYFGQDENDQHPPTGVTPGEQLIARVYNAIRDNEALWKSTLLIVTYDEHGGFFDHVPPPATVAPDGNTREYAFDQLGVRVPAILVSPWVERGVCKTQFDHTSVLRYACDKWGMEQLSNRAQPNAGACRSKSLLPELTRLAAPREDTPQSIAARPLPRGRAVAVETPVEGAREALMYFLATLPQAAAKPGMRAARKGRAPAPAELRRLGDRQLHELAMQRLDELLSSPSPQPAAGHNLRAKWQTTKAAARPKKTTGKTGATKTGKKK